MVRRAIGLVVAGCVVLAATPADARVVRFVVERTIPFAGGRVLGDRGAFERLEGTVYMEVDPSDPLNKIIVNLDKAPRNRNGRVEFDAPFIIIKPVEMRRGNQKILYGVNNRGNGVELGVMLAFPGQQPTPPIDDSDALIFELGYTYVDAGWAGDVTTVFANVEFADPSVYSRQDQHTDYLSQSYPPLTYAVTTDPISGIRDGILKRPATDPLVFHVDSANEFWQMQASLNVHDGRGNPVPMHPNVRLYSVASHSHTGASGVAATPTAKGVCRYPTNGYFSYTPLLRALLVALDDWADRGIEPPASRYPDVRNQTLVTREEAIKALPAIPHVTYPTVLNELARLDYDAGFGSTGGRLKRLPPARGERYQVLVPKPDEDGLDAGGIRTVDVAVPVGTNFGWNLRPAGPRGADLCGLSGSFVPFAATRAERTASSDPRRSLEERYRNHAGFVTAVEEATRTLMNERFLLEQDARTIQTIAEASDILR